jgi:hypothetical protein
MFCAPGPVYTYEAGVQEVSMIELTALVAILQDKPLQEWAGACQGERTRIEARELSRVTSHEDWVKLWRRHTGDDRSEPPKVDFERHMVVALFFGKCGWARSGHETKIVFGSWEGDEKDSRLKLSIEASLARYMCRDSFPFWIGVFPKRAGPIVVTGEVRSMGGEGRPVEIGKIP